MFFPQAPNLDLGTPQTGPGLPSAATSDAQTTPGLANGSSPPLGSGLFPSPSLNLAPAPSPEGVPPPRPAPSGMALPPGAPPGAPPGVALPAAPPGVAPPGVAPPGVALPSGAPTREPQGQPSWMTGGPPTGMPQPAGQSAPVSSPFAESKPLFSPPAQSEAQTGSTAWMTGGPPAGMSLPAGQSAPASSPFAESKPLSSPLHIFADSKASMASAPIAEQPCPASSLLVESKPQFSPPAGPQGPATSSSSRGVLAFSADGKMLRAGLNGDAKEYSVQDLLKSNAGVWMQNLESFPGPFGGVDGHTTEVLLEYLEKMATRLDDGDAQCCTLESAAAFPESAATACRFLCCLVRANGDVQSSEFWQHFSPVLARRAQAMRRDRETSDLRKFC
ncbi:unnamed protein product, partial [Durusdinium trenchii]